MTRDDAVRRAHWLMVALVFVVALLNLLFAERIPLSGGFGTDGTNYGSIAMRFPDLVFGHQVNPYYLKRSAPSFFVHYGLRAFGRPTDVPHVILGFQVLNLVLLTLSAALWKPIADELRLGLASRWLGFVGLFVSYANVKHAFYMPVFTDVSAFALGVLYLWAYLTRRQVVLFAVTLIGAFCWPIAAACGAVLLLFPRGSSSATDEPRSPLPTLAAVVLAAAMLGGFSYMYFVRGLRKAGTGPTIAPIDELVPIAMLLYGLYIVLGVRTLLAGIGTGYVVRAVRAMRPRPALYALAALAIPVIVVRLLQSNEIPVLEPRGFLRMVFFSPNARPGVFWVGHVIWWGPILWLVLFFWKDVARVVRSFGPGLVAFFAFTFFVQLTAESRQSSMGIPFVVAMLCAALDPLHLPARLHWVVAGLSAVFTKIWLRINTPEAIAFAESGKRGLSDADSAIQYRYYYLSQAPWMPNRWYVIQGLVVLAVGAVLYLLVRRQRAAALVEREGGGPAPGLFARP